MRTSPLAALSVALLAGFAAFLGIGSLGPQSLPEAKADSVTLNQGHIDAFHVTSSGKGNLKLDLTEDATGSHVAHDPNNVTLEVGAHAYEPRTKDVAEVGVPTYFLPQTQAQDLIWPGWDTQGVAPHYQGVKINFNRVCGPGRVFMWSQAFGGGATPLLSDGVEVKSGNSIDQANPSHVHANWGFERPGRYSMQVQATADGAESEVKTYTWVVGKSDQDSNADEPAEGPPRAEARTQTLAPGHRTTRTAVVTPAAALPAVVPLAPALGTRPVLRARPAPRVSRAPQESPPLPAALPAPPVPRARKARPPARRANLPSARKLRTTASSQRSGPAPAR